MSESGIIINNESKVRAEEYAKTIMKEISWEDVISQTVEEAAKVCESLYMTGVPILGTDDTKAASGPDYAQAVRDNLEKIIKRVLN